MPIDAVIFDLFGVVIAFDDDIVVRRIARHCADPDVAFRALRGVVSCEDLICGRLTLGALHGKLVAAHGLDLDLPAFEALWLEPYSAPEPGMAELIETLARMHRLVLLSNVDRYYWEVVRRAHPELERFSALLLSWQEGLAKPDPFFFARAVEVAGTAAARCLFVDDKEENVAAARAAGLRAHKFAGVAGLRHALGEEGVKGL